MVYLLNRCGYNSYVTHNRNIITGTVIKQFISLGITQVNHLCEMKSYEPQFRSRTIFESFETRNNSNIFTTTLEWCVAQFLTLGDRFCYKTCGLILKYPMKNQNLSALEVHQRKNSICLLLIVDFLMMIMIL